EYAWYHGGRELYENVSFANSSTRTYKLSTQDSQGQEQLTVAFSNGAASQTVLQPNVNGSNLAEISLSATAKYIYATEATRTYDVRSYSQGADWTVRLTSTAGNEARLNYLALHYSRQLTPRQGYVCFSREARPAQFNITGTGLQVMRIGERGDAACLMTGTQDGDVLRVTVDDASRRYVAFDPSYSFPQPNVVGEVANQDLHGLDSLDMVILIPSSGKLRAQAERLADAHRQYDQLRVAVLTANQVYNEFSSGTPDATAYRRFMKMLYDRAASGGLSPRYLLLFGDCAWDNRMISTAWRRTNPDDYLLCFESDNSVSATRCFVMEDYFGLLDDGEGGNLLKDKCDLGVGRFPVVTASQAKVMVDKTIAFLSNQNAGSWRNVVCMMGDDGDENEHMRYSDDVAERILQDNPSMEVRKVMWDAYTRVSTTRCNTYPEVVSLLKKQMDEGALVMNYCGHANATSLSHELVLMLEDFQAFRGTRLPLWLTAACDVMPFDGATDNIGETAVLNENGAALAFYGTTRTVYATQNLAMNRYFMHYLFASDAAGQRYRVGDAVCLAKNDIITDGGSDLSAPENKLHYALLGDPALTFGAPRQQVTLDSINGHAVDGSEIVTLKAGQHVRFSGSVRQADGSLLPAFRGVVSARLFDSLHKITCKNNAGATTSFSFSDRGTALYTAQDSVRDGHFSLSFIVPLDIANGVTAARLLFYALSADTTVEASGYSEDFVLGDVSDELGADTLGPTVYAYLRNEDFQNGDVVNAEPYFVAQLEDESGVSVSGNG
ncbi:MAG: type IX secretion system sortase PorU, partial [Bacteroidaceae bacterium]|nr:type IX secretion system sortase PorU [Bacteroidaceae bacterium]